MSLDILYLKNDTTGQISEFVSYQVGWSPASAEDPPVPQEEIDAYLLMQAKLAKVATLKADLDAFLNTGLEYGGDITCAGWNSGTTYVLHDLVLAYDSKNYQSLQDSNLNNDPVSSPSEWKEFIPVFRTDDEVMINLSVKRGSSSGSQDRYKYYSIQEADGFRHFIDFGSNPAWLAFSETLSDEKNRIMVKYNNYRTQIAMCADVAAVDAIVIDFNV